MNKISKLQRKKNNPNSSYWMSKCDKLFAEIFHNSKSNQNCLVGLVLDNHTCSGNLELHHLLPRQNYLHRWNFDNAFPLCSFHHKFCIKLSAHGSPLLFAEFLQNNWKRHWQFVCNNKNIITRKSELPFTFKEKYYELTKLTNN